MKTRKLLKEPKTVFVSVCLVISTLSCNVNPSGNFVGGDVKPLPLKSGNSYSGNTGKLLTAEITQLLGEPDSDEPPNYGDPPPVAVNPHLEVLDEKYSKCRGIDIREISILDIQRLFETNQLSTVELTKCYLERLDRMNEVLRVVVEVNPDALNAALSLDLERNFGKSRGGMHGIPVLVKDAIGTLDRTETTIGSPALIGIRPKRDADVVASLRKAGALILGKSHCQDIYGGTNIPWGWSGRGGQTRNAYNLSVTPQGSSSGSAVGISANLVPVALGSETDGSIIVPASLAGIVGVKPTFGLPSIKGAIPLSSNQDHIGPMAKTVLDSALLLDAMTSDSERPPHHPDSYAEYITTHKFTRPFRVGVPRFPFWDTSIISSINLQNQLPQLERMVQVMKDSPNFNVVDPVVPSFQNISISKYFHFKKYFRYSLFTVLYHDFKHDFNEYLKNDVVNSYPISRPTNPFTQTPESYISVIAPTRKIASLQDLIEYNEEHPTTEGYNQEHLINAQATDGILNQTYIEFRDSNRVAAREYLDSVFERYNLDAIVTPSEYRVEAILKKNLEDFPVFGYTIACIAGYPSINIPAGIGLRAAPFGISFLAKPYDEPTLFLVAHHAEQLNPQRTTPRFLI